MLFANKNPQFFLAEGSPAMLQAENARLGSHQKTRTHGRRAWKPQFSPTHSGRSFAQRKRFRMTVIEAVVRGRSLVHWNSYRDTETNDTGSGNSFYAPRHFAARNNAALLSPAVLLLIRYLLPVRTNRALLFIRGAFHWRESRNGIRNRRTLHRHQGHGVRRCVPGGLHPPQKGRRPSR